MASIGPNSDTMCYGCGRHLSTEGQIRQLGKIYDIEAITPRAPLVVLVIGWHL